jgi:transcriptional regulator with XRE-family HTH domain
VDVGTLSAVARAEVPPKASTISSAVINRDVTENRNSVQEALPKQVIYALFGGAHSEGMLDTAELLARIEARGISNSDVARVLNLSPSRITELRKGERTLKLEEAVKLVRVFGLEQDSPATPLPVPIVRLLVRYIGERMDASLEGEALLELTEDVRAFAEFVADPKVRDNLTAAEAFFQAMRLRRPTSPEEARQETDPRPAH